MNKTNKLPRIVLIFALTTMSSVITASADASPHTLLAASISNGMPFGKTLTLSINAQSMLGIMLGREIPNTVKKNDLHGVSFKGKEKSLFLIAKHLNNASGNLQLTLLELARKDDAASVEALGVLDAALNDNLKLRRELLSSYVDYISQPVIALGGGIELAPEMLDDATVLEHAYGAAFTQAIKMDNLQIAAKFENLGAYIYSEITSYVQSKEAIDYLSTVVDLYAIDSLYGAFSISKHSEHLFIYYLSKLQPNDLAMVLLKTAEDGSGRTFIDDLYAVFAEYHADTIIANSIAPAEVLGDVIDVALGRIMLAKKQAGTDVRFAEEAMEQ